MATEEKEKNPQPVVDDDDPTPYFKIGAHRFASGVGMFEPGDVIPWQVPEHWNEKLNGKHYAAHGPSITWTPLNKAAKKLHEAQHAKVTKMNTPPPDPSVERMRKLEESLGKMAEAQAKNTEVLTALLEKLVSKK